MASRLLTTRGNIIVLQNYSKSAMRACTSGIPMNSEP